MAIDPEVIPPSSSDGNNAVTFIPKWVLFGMIGLGVLIVVSLLNMLLPLILMGLVLGFIWRKASNY